MLNLNLAFVFFQRAFFCVGGGGWGGRGASYYVIFCHPPQSAQLFGPLVFSYLFKKLFLVFAWRILTFLLCILFVGRRSKWSFSNVDVWKACAAGVLQKFGSVFAKSAKECSRESTRLPCWRTRCWQRLVRMSPLLWVRALLLLVVALLPMNHTSKLRPVR
jgi:hypothetical protein